MAERRLVAPEAAGSSPVGQPLTRRGFFGLLAGAATAAVVPWQRLLPQRLLPPRLLAVDRQTGIAVRFIKSYDIQAAQRVDRLDVIALEPPRLPARQTVSPMALVVDGERDGDISLDLLKSPSDAPVPALDTEPDWSRFSQPDGPRIAQRRDAVQFVRLPAIAFGPRDLTFQLSLTPTASDRLLTVAAWDIDTKPAPRVQYSELDLQGEQSARFFTVPPRGDWRMSAGHYQFVATVGTLSVVRARTEQAVWLVP